MRSLNIHSVSFFLLLYGTQKSMNVHFWLALSTTTRSGLLASIPLPTRSLRSQNISIEPSSDLQTELGRWLYHFSAQPIPNFLQSSQWMRAPILSCRIRYCFLASSEQPLTTCLTVSNHFPQIRHKPSSPSAPSIVAFLHLVYRACS